MRGEVKSSRDSALFTLSQILRIQQSQSTKLKEMSSFDHCDRLILALTSINDSCSNLGDVIKIVEEIKTLSEGSDVVQQEFGAQNDGALIGVLGSFLNKQEIISHSDVGMKNSAISAALWALCRLCRREMDKSTACIDNIVHVAKYIESIVNTMNTNIHSAAIVYPCCWIFMILASDSDDRQDVIISSGGGIPVIETLRIHASDANIAEFSCRAIRNLSISDENTVKLVENGAIPVLRDVCQYYSIAGDVNVAVSEALMWAMVNLSCDEQVAAQLGVAGCCEQVVLVASGLLNHPDNLIAAISALRNMTTLNALNYSWFAETSICEVLIAIASTHSNHPKIIEICFWTMANLACDMELSKRLVRLGVPHQMLSVLAVQRISSENAESPYIAFGPIAESFLWFTRNLAASCQENRNELGDLGYIPEILHVLRSYRDREGMVEVAFACLHNMCDQSIANIRRVGDENGLQLIMEVFQQQQGVVDVVEYGLKLLALLCREDADCAALLSAGFVIGESANPVPVMALALDCVFNHIGEPDIFRYCCDITLVLRYTTPEMRALLQEKGVITTDGPYPRAKSPTGKFHTLVEAWGLVELATEFGVNTHPEGWDPSMIVSVPQSMLGAFMGGLGANVVDLGNIQDE